MEKRISSRRIAIYALLLITATGVGISSKYYLDSLNAHDYAHRRSTVDLSPKTVTLSHANYAAYLEDAFDVRASDESDPPTITFQAGMCLLARRAKEGTQPTAIDHLVTQAVIDMVQQASVQEYLEVGLERLRTAYDQEAAAGGSPSLDRLRAELIDGLMRHPEFREQFTASLERSAAAARQTIIWADATSDEGRQIR